VSASYKAKANVVRLVDIRETDGSKPGRGLDWLKRSEADDIPSQEPGLYSN
jgi:hypothetical protein